MIKLEFSGYLLIFKQQLFLESSDTLLSLLQLLPQPSIVGKNKTDQWWQKFIITTLLKLKKNFKATSKPSNIKYQKINTECVRNFQGSVRNWKRLYEVQYFIFFSFRFFWNLLKSPLPFANLPSFSLWLEWTQSWSHFITLPMAFLAKNLWVWKDTANRRLFFWVKCLALLRNKCKARASQRTNRWDVAFVVIPHWSAS